MLGASDTSQKNGDTSLHKILSHYEQYGLFTHGAARIGTFKSDGLSVHASACIEPEGRKIYDLSSLTKPLVTGTLVYRQIHTGAWTLKTKIGDLLTGSQWKGLSSDIRAVPLEELLNHTSGLPFWRNFFVGCEKPQAVATKAEDKIKRIMEVLGRVDLDRKKSHVYSDLGFILLGEALEETLKRPIDEIFDALKKDLKMARSNDLSYRGTSGPSAGVVPTAYCALRQRMLVGEVQDENCAYLGGKTGHAGLFGSADGVLAYAEALITSDFGRAYIAAAADCGQRTKGKKDHALGWDRLLSEPMRKFGSGDAIGHNGFTGTMLWIDPQTLNFILLFTNRIHSGRVTPLLTKCRAAVVDAANAFFSTQKK